MESVPYEIFGIDKIFMNNKTIYALGFFDGVHLGHQALLSACAELAREDRCQCGAVTFDTHPDSLVLHNAPGLINTIADRKALLSRFDMEQIVVLPFDDAMRCLPWEAFLTMLIRDHHAAGFVCGEDFRFGYRGAGNAHALAGFCREKNLPCAIVADRLLEGQRVSSTAIRNMLKNGDIARANRFLGHDHILTGPVVHGHQLGRTLGIPTANLALPAGLAVPKFGVYACLAYADGKCYPAVTNIGVRPTVSGEGITVEPWLLDYQGDLYGQELTLEFHAFLRPEKKFPDLATLKNAVLENARQTRQLLNEG